MASSKVAGPRIIRHQDWEITSDKFAFMDGAVKTNNGGLATGFRYDGSKLRLKTPKMRCPWGLQTGLNGNGFNMQLSFDDSEESQALKAKFQAMDELVLAAGQAHPKEWFALSKSGKPVSSAVIEDKYSPIVKESKKEGFQPTIRVKLPCKRTTIPDPNNPEGDRIETEAFDCRLYSRSKEQIAIDDESLAGGCYVSVLMAISSIWSTTTGFGVTLKAEQIMVFPSENQMPAHCLLDSDEEDGSEEGMANHAPIDLDSDAEGSDDAEAGSDVDDVEAEPEAEPEPVMTKKPAGRPRKATAKK